MKRFTVTLTKNNLSGPFDIYYNGTILANLEAGGSATNISAATLSSGVSITTGDNATTIDLLNLKETCNNVISVNV
jgi:hypothetical protein